MSKVMAFVDGSLYARSVCDHAAWVSNRISASVEVLHVLGRRDISAGAGGDFTGALDANARDNLLTELAALDEQKAKLAQKRGRLLLDQATAWLKEAGVQSVSTKLRLGDLVETVEDLEVDADLHVFGKRGEAADFAKLHLGSNLERVVRASQKPILVASRAFKPISRVLIAFDGGPSVGRAVNYLCESHELFAGLSVHVLYVGERTDATASIVDNVASRLRTTGYNTSSEVMSGQPEIVISNTVASAGFDLLVMGAYGHSRIRSLIVGSTTTEMVRSCLVPVVLFR
jgi:nucleotide-binding universal stress UspA family protein